VRNFLTLLVKEEKAVFSSPIAYAIVAGAQVPPPVATGKIIRSHTLLRHFRAGGRTVVTWIRHGHTCVLSARDVPLQAMVGLAAWKDGAGLTF